MKKIKFFEEGDIFIIPFGISQYTIGVISRKNDAKMLAYYFSEIYDNPPNNINIRSCKVLLVKLTSTLGLEKGEWAIVEKSQFWSSKDWPVPLFKRKDLISGKCNVVHYDDTLNLIDVSEAENCDSVDNLPEDGLAGYIFIEKRIKSLLSH